LSSGKYSFETDDGTVIYEFTLTSSYQSMWICSDSLTVGNSYKILKDGSSFTSWKQSSSTQSVN